MTSRMLLATFAVATMTACVEEEPVVATPSPEPTPPPASTPGVTTPTSSAPPSGDLTSGRLTFQLSGDVEVEKTLETLVSTFYAPPPGGLTIVWTAGGGDATTVGVGGSTFTGTRASSPTLSVSVIAQTSGKIVRFVSTDGECDITIDVADADRVSGGFECDDLVASSGEVVDASASFAATG
jgi:hypothetical protein